MQVFGRHGSKMVGRRFWPEAILSTHDLVMPVYSDGEERLRSFVDTWMEQSWQQILAPMDGARCSLSCTLGAVPSARAMIAWCCADAELGNLSGWPTFISVSCGHSYSGNGLAAEKAEQALPGTDVRQLCYYATPDKEAFDISFGDEWMEQQERHLAVLLQLVKSFTEQQLHSKEAVLQLALAAYRRWVMGHLDIVGPALCRKQLLDVVSAALMPAACSAWLPVCICWLLCC